MGLHICQTLIGYLGPNNKIYVKSQLGKGSTFSFLIFSDNSKNINNNNNNNINYNNLNNNTNINNNNIYEENFSP